MVTGLVRVLCGCIAVPRLWLNTTTAVFFDPRHPLWASPAGSAPPLLMARVAAVSCCGLRLGSADMADSSLCVISGRLPPQPDGLLSRGTSGLQSRAFSGSRHGPHSPLSPLHPADSVSRAQSRVMGDVAHGCGHLEGPPE